MKVSGTGYRLLYLHPDRIDDTNDKMVDFDVNMCVITGCCDLSDITGLLSSETQVGRCGGVRRYSEYSRKSSKNFDYLPNVRSTFPFLSQCSF